MATKRKQKKSRPTGRGVPFRNPKKAILVVCEGEKTEEQYFNDMRRIERLHSAKVKVVARGEPRSIIDFAKTQAKEFEIIVCIYDCDNRAKYKNYNIEARDNDFALGVSNPCFELWCLLHYTDQTAAIESRKAISGLKEHLPQYEKKMGGIYAALQKRQKQAMTRAGKLREMHKKNKAYSYSNPCTTVDEIVQLLLDLRD